MAEINLSTLYSIYGIAIVFLVIRLYTKKKRDFLISSFIIFVGSIYTVLNLPYSVLNYFLLAMSFSFLGDLLMAEVLKFTQARIIDGVIAFGIGHILYIVGFVQLNVGGYGSKLFWMVPLGLLLASGLYYIIGYNPEFHALYKFVHFLYALIITGVFIAVLAFAIRDTAPLIASIISLLGIILFMISDGVLAYNEFKEKIPQAKDIVAATYIMGQILLQLTPVMTLFTT